MTKIVKLLEKNIGRKIRFLSNGNNTAENDDANEDLEDMEEECEPDSMQETQDKCMVSQIPYTMLIKTLHKLTHYHYPRFQLSRTNRSRFIENGVLALLNSATPSLVTY